MAAAAVPAAGFGELEVRSTADMARVVASQRELFNIHTSKLQDLVVAQCRQTGVNPLSQQMAVGALSIKIGKRPKDLLNPKAVKYMQSIFSIKDSLNKTETREISTLCRLTATQVRDYFASQRAKVRKLVCLSKKNTSGSDASVRSSVGGSSNTDQSPSVTEVSAVNTLVPSVPGENGDNNNSGEYVQLPEVSTNFATDQVQQQGLLNTTALTTTDEDPSCSTQDEIVPEINSDDKKFLENIFNLMRKEEKFSGQTKLMEWILQIRSSDVLHWFLTKGGLPILATWLSQAAAEEQTTLLLVMFKVLGHLPLHKALPVQMKAILQTVNRLRFYRTSEISNKAKALLSRWSKLFLRSQAQKKPSLTGPNDAQKEMLRIQSEILGEDSWPLDIDIPEEIFAIEGIPDGISKSQPMKRQKLLANTAGSDSALKTKLRRKVVLVEQPDRRSAGKSVQTSRAVPSNQSRPMSADDIQKAKKHNIFMQNKYGKNIASASENLSPKTEDCKPACALQMKTSEPASEKNIASTSENHPPKTEECKPACATHMKTSEPVSDKNNAPIRQNKPPKIEPIIEECKPACATEMEISEPGSGKIIAPANENQFPKTEDCKPSRIETSDSARVNPPPQPQSEPQPRRDRPKISSEPARKTTQSMEVKKNQFQWQKPPAMRLDSAWKVGCGENSKEIAVQNQRNRREKETFYTNLGDILPNPKEPWDLDMDFDDSLTPEIPVEQLHEADFMEVSTSCSPQDSRDTAAAIENNHVPVPVAAPVPVIAPAPAPASSSAAPDLELLAVLLKNPELVFALTSGQGSNMSNQQTLALLDTLKRSGIGLPNGPANGSVERPMMPVPTSLASPTPSDAARTSFTEFTVQSRTPVSQPHFPAQASIKSIPPPPPVAPHPPATIFSTAQLTVTMNSTQQPPNRPPPPTVQMQQNQIPQRPVYHHSVNNIPQPVQQHHKHHFGHHATITHPQTPLLPTPSRLQPHSLAEPSTFQPRYTETWYPGAPDNRISTARGEVLETPAADVHFQHNQANYNVIQYPNGYTHSRETGERYKMPVGPTLKPWSPDRRNGRSEDVRSGWTCTDVKRDSGRDDRPVLSKQRNHGRRDRDRGRHWPNGSRWHDGDRHRSRN